MRKLLIIGLLLLAMSPCTFSQADFYALSQEGVRDRINSLEKSLPALSSLTRIDCLNDISESFLAFNLDSAKVWAELALQEAVENNYFKGQAKAYRNLGRIKCIAVKDLPLAEKDFAKSLGLYLRTGDVQQIAWAWGALGYTKWVLTKFPEAVGALEKAEHLFQKIDDTANLAGTYFLRINTEMQWGRYAKSLEYILKYQDVTGEEDYHSLYSLYTALGENEIAEEYFHKLPLLNYGAYKNILLAKACFRKKQYDSVRYYYGLYTKQSGDTECSAVYLGLGELHLALKQYGDALHCLNKAMLLATKANDQNQVMRLLLFVSRAQMEKGQNEQAIKNARRLLAVATKSGATQFRRDAHFLLYQLFDSMFNDGRAYLHLKKYIQLKDSIDADLSIQKLAVSQIKAERGKAQDSIQLLKQDSRLQQQQLKQTAQQKHFLLAGIAALLLIGIILIRNALLRRKDEQHRRELAENELQIEKLENEKKQAAFQHQKTDLEMQALRAQMNPHFIFNCLNSINHYILKNKTEAASDYLSKFSKLIRLVLNLSEKNQIPLKDEMECLELYIQLEQLRFNNHFTYSISCSEDIYLEEVMIPPLLLQPFVENAIWHGLMHKKERGHLEIELAREDVVLCCTITDNGVGRRKAADLKENLPIHQSRGMQITTNRLRLLTDDQSHQATLTIIDLIDQEGNESGTKVKITIPT